MLSIETRKEIERRAIEIAAELDEKLGPYRAEILPDVSPLWHVATTVDGERDAIEWLSKRGFGVYSPSFELTKIVRGRKVTYQKPLFPGHIFIFVWDIKRHWRRIRVCPGVARILTVDEGPVVVPFEAIYRMQAIEFSGMECLVPRRRRRRKKNRSDDFDLKDGDVMSISPKSYWKGIEELDDAARNRLLHVALGLEDAA